MYVSMLFMADWPTAVKFTELEAQKTGLGFKLKKILIS